MGIETNEWWRLLPFRNWNLFVLACNFHGAFCISFSLVVQTAKELMSKGDWLQPTVHLHGNSHPGVTNSILLTLSSACNAIYGKYGIFISEWNEVLWHAVAESVIKFCVWLVASLTWFCKERRCPVLSSTTPFHWGAGWLWRWSCQQQGGCSSSTVSVRLSFSWDCEERSKSIKLIRSNKE